eukprot:276486_1
MNDAFVPSDTYRSSLDMRESMIDAITDPNSHQSVFTSLELLLSNHWSFEGKYHYQTIHPMIELDDLFKQQEMNGGQICVRKQKNSKRYICVGDGVKQYEVEMIMNKNTNNVYLRCLPRKYTEQKLTQVCTPYGELS